MKKKRKIIFTIFLAICDLCAIACFILFYCTKFKTIFINTAMNTMEHQYLARVFYSDKTIKKVMASNYFIVLKEEVNLDDVVIDTSIKTTFKDKYEEEIDDRDENEDIDDIEDLG